MLKRIVTGVAAAAAGVAIIALRNWQGGVLLYGAVLLLYMVSLNEMISALRAKGLKPSGWAIYLTGALLLPAYLWRGAQGLLIVYCLGAVLAMCSAIFIRDPREGDLIATAFPLIYPTLPFVALFMIAALPEPYNLQILLTVLLSSIASDVFALVFGMWLGKHKLIPSVSPKKTWEGAIGGLVASTAILAAFGIAIGFFRDDAMWIWHYIAMGALGSAATQLGDLVASVIKRYCGVKDFGKFFPGHGGVLDRFDGILFNAVFIFIYSMLVVGGLR